MKKKPLPWHTPLIAIYPPLYIFSRNVARLELSELAIPIPLIAILAALSLGILYLFLRDLRKAALLATPAWLLFWYYADIYGYIEPWTIGDLHVGRQRYLVPVLVVLIGLIVWIVWRSEKEHQKLTRILNVVSTCLVLVASVTVVSYRVTNSLTSTDTASTSDMTEVEGPLPDVYYIVLDGYGRQDILADLMDYDNSAFIEGLRERGFYVADKACSNYCQTQLSLGSSLNLDYLQSLPVGLDPTSGDRLPATQLFQSNKLQADLRAIGYSIVSFPTGFAPTELRKADHYVSFGRNLSNYQSMILCASPLPLLQSGFVEGRLDIHRQRIVQTLAHLGEENIHPKYVFAHLLSPHPPFVFGPNGQSVRYNERSDIWDASHLLALTGMTQEQYIAAYCDQITYLNTLVLTAIDDVLANSPEPPIIVIQGDHGPGSHLDWESMENSYLPERLSILNAYYFPDRDYSRLYPEITPVNSFRVILDQYFGQDHELLPDRSYFSTWSRPYAFADATDLVRAIGQEATGR